MEVETKTSDATSPLSKNIKQLREKFAPDAVQIGEHYYKIVKGEITWHDAVKACEAAGGYLVCLETDEEQKAVADLRGSLNCLWIGAKKGENGKFAWLNGKDLKQSVIARNSQFHYVSFAGAGDFHVRPNSGRVTEYNTKSIQGFICEWEE